MNILSQYIKLVEDGGGAGGVGSGGADGDAVATNVVGDGTGAIQLWTPPLGKKIAKHGLLEADDFTPTQEPYVKIPTSADDPPNELYNFIQAQRKANDPDTE